MLSPTHTLILIQNASFDIYQQPNIMQSFDSNNIIYSKNIHIQTIIVLYDHLWWSDDDGRGVCCPWPSLTQRASSGVWGEKGWLGIAQATFTAANPFGEELYRNRKKLSICLNKSFPAQNYSSWPLQSDGRSPTQFKFKSLNLLKETKNRKQIVFLPIQLPCWPFPPSPCVSRTRLQDKEARITTGRDNSSDNGRLCSTVNPSSAKGLSPKWIYRRNQPL